MDWIKAIPRERFENFCKHVGKPLHTVMRTIQGSPVLYQGKHIGDFYCTLSGTLCTQVITGCKLEAAEEDKLNIQFSSGDNPVFLVYLRSKTKQRGLVVLDSLENFKNEVRSGTIPVNFVTANGLVPATYAVHSISGAILIDMPEEIPTSGKAKAEYFTSNKKLSNIDIRMI